MPLIFLSCCVFLCNLSTHVTSTFPNAIVISPSPLSFPLFFIFCLIFLIFFLFYLLIFYYAFSIVPILSMSLLFHLYVILHLFFVNNVYRYSITWFLFSPLLLFPFLSVIIFFHPLSSNNYWPFFGLLADILDLKSSVPFLSYTVKKVSDFPVPSANLSLQCSSTTLNFRYCLASIVIYLVKYIRV